MTKLNLTFVSDWGSSKSSQQVGREPCSNRARPGAGCALEKSAQWFPRPGLASVESGVGGLKDSNAVPRSQGGHGPALGF